MANQVIIKEYYLRCVWAHLDWQAAEQTDLGAGPPAKIIQETDKNPVRKSIADNGLHKNRTRRPKAAPKSQTDGQLEQTQREGILPQLSEPQLEILQPVAEGHRNSSEEALQKQKLDTTIPTTTYFHVTVPTHCKQRRTIYWVLLFSDQLYWFL